MRPPRDAAVAASGQWRDPGEIRSPAGTVHAWLPGTNQTLCGLPLSRSALLRFPHVAWADAQPATGRDADRVAEVCPRCAAGIGRRRGSAGTVAQREPRLSGPRGR